MTLKNFRIVGNGLRIVSLFLFTVLSLLRDSSGYLDVNQYCKAFDVNFKPIICIIKNGTGAHPPPNHNPSHPHPHPPPPPPTQYPILYPPPPQQPPPPPDYIDFDEDDDDCS